MIKELDFSKFENPSVQVVWEDLPENFTQDKIKSVKHYFQKKYNTTNVNVLTKVKNVETSTMQSIDVSVNISDANYQLELLKKFLDSKGYEKYHDNILSINKMVENKMLEKQEESTQFKKWYIRNIEFSNFLSYGENQRLDFDSLNGIVVIESNPPNFGGKTVLSVDLLMFLFFNETTKTSKAEEIFNLCETGLILKTAAISGDKSNIDLALGLNLINYNNVKRFKLIVPEIFQMLDKLCKLLIIKRMNRGLFTLDESELTQSIHALDNIANSLNSL
jgi:hypothetical protein